MEAKILHDVAKLYRFLAQENSAINMYYQTANLQNVPPFLQEIFICLPQNQEILLTLIDRVLSLREESLENVLKKHDFSKDRIAEIKDSMFFITEKFYKEKHEKILDFVQKEKLLTPFLRTLLKSVHKIGLQFNNFFKNWHKTLILGINKDLNETYNYNLQKILEVLQTSVEVSKSGEIGDRSYSLPILIEGSYQAVAYADFFKEDFLEFKKVFEEVLIALEGIDEVCSKLEQKEFYLKYLRTLKKALLQHNIEELLESWREVDRAWMQITSPLQIGHPLEYYEDHFRRAVAPEWDLRIARIYQGKDLLVENSNHDGDVSLNKESMLDFYRYLSNQMPQTQFKTDIDSCVQRSLEQTQSYGGMPLLFYGSELNGLFSAQVIPNDESVSAEYGKKIFYFPDQVRELAYVKPFMRLSSKTFPQDFLDFNRELLYFRKEDWYKVYEITTIGHEFGHILWVGLDSELQMNRGGEFKNIEEFKATMGGLAYYFVRGNKRLLKEILFNTIARAVSSIALQRENEVLPYYCEGLIHLDILFTSGVLKYKGSFEQIALEIHQECLEDLVEHYLKIYYSLIRVYLEKIDAREFLSQFIQRDKGIFKPLKKEVLSFVEDYYAQYQKIGQQIDVLTPAMWRENYQKQKS